MTTITIKSLQAAHPKQAPYFLRDAKIKGFAAKINPSGSVQLIAEVRHKGRTIRKTIGRHPHRHQRGTSAGHHFYFFIFMEIRVNSCFNFIEHQGPIMQKLFCDERLQQAIIFDNQSKLQQFSYKALPSVPEAFCENKHDNLQ